MSNTVQTYLKYANVQMASEAFLDKAYGFDEKLGRYVYRVEDVKRELLNGNEFNSVFPDTLADDFIQNWEVTAHQPNTPSGFSGTLFRGKGDDNAGELVLSFRSTEFIGDAMRDSFSTNRVIYAHGFGFGQIADMRTWFESAQVQAAVGAAPVTLTGYSLGGHLTNAFNLLYPARAAATYTFNGAGTGLVNGSLWAVIDQFEALGRNHGGNGERFGSPEVRALYEALTARQGFGGGFGGEPGLLTLADRTQVYTLSQTLTNPVHREQALWLQHAIENVLEVQIERARVSVDAIMEEKWRWPLGRIEGASLDYWLGVSEAAKLTASTNTTALNDRGRATQGAPFAGPVFNIYGRETSNPNGNLSAVANSQIHYGTDAAVYIEGQPLYRGNVVSGVLSESDFNEIITLDLRLLVPNPELNAFGDTHSLVLLVDSLAVLEVLASLAPSAERSALEALLSAATADRVSQVPGSQGKPEGRTLETVVDWLTKAITGNDPGLRTRSGLLEGNTWHEINSREALHGQLATLKSAIKANPGLALVSLLEHDVDVLEAARTGPDALAYRYALKELMPLAVTGTDYGARFTNGELDLYDPETGAGELTETWLAERAAFLGYITGRNIRNDVSVTIVDRARPENVRFFDAATAQGINVDKTTNTPTPEMRARVMFGGDAAEGITGANLNDRLYGGAGMDTLTGGAGNDYLEGGTDDDSLIGETDQDTLIGGFGSDHLNGGDGNDVLEGGLGEDTLVGGPGDDTLRGGTDEDRYEFSGDFGTDEIEDSDGLGGLWLDGQRIGVLTEVDGAPGVFRDENGRFEAHEVSGRDLLIRMISGSATGTIIVRGWTDGHLGMTRTEVAPQAEPAASPRQGDGFDNHLSSPWPGTSTVGVTLRAGGGVDHILGGAGDDLLQGDSGNDLIAGFGGADTIDGGEGDDYITWVDGGSVVRGGPDNDQVRADRKDRIAIRELDVPIIGDMAWVDVIWNDIRWYRERETEVWSLRVNERLIERVFDDWGDFATGVYSAASVLGNGWTYELVVYGPGTESGNLWRLNYFHPEHAPESVSPSANYNFRSLAYRHQEMITVFGDGGDDLLVANDGADALYGGEGDDVVYGLGGSDVVEGGPGEDLLIGGAGNDTLFGGNDDDVLKGDIYFADDTVGGVDGHDYLDGGGGADLILGDGGNDTMHGGRGNDTLHGNDGDDVANGGAGDDLLTGGNGSDTLLGSGGVDELRGGQGDDLLQGGDDGDRDNDNDTLWGQEGDDTLLGGHGGDRLNGGEGDDLLDGGAGYDTLWGEIGDDTLHGGGGNDYLHGGEDNDLLIGGAGDDALFGDDGDDTLSGGPGLDYLNGGKDDDTYVYDIGDAPRVVGTGVTWLDTIADSEGSNTLVLAGAESSDNVRTFVRGDNLEVRYGASDALLIQGGASGGISTFRLANGETYGRSAFIALTQPKPENLVLNGTWPGHNLNGGDGDDTLTAHEGGGSLLGSAGDDLLIGGDGNDVHVGGPGNDRALDFGTASGDLYRFARGNGRFSIEDRGGSDRLEFGDGIMPADVAISRSGGDMHIDLGEDDSLVVMNMFDPESGDYLGSRGIEVIRFADGTEWGLAGILADLGLSPGETPAIVGTDGNDTLSGGGDDDILEGRGGNDQLYGNGGNDTLRGGDGADYLDGGAGNDLLDGGTDDDWLTGGAGDDTLLGGEGRDSLYGGQGDDVLRGEAGNDQLFGDDGNDLLDGGAGDDTLRGGAGDDTPIGGEGYDRLEGGAGDDRLAGGPGGGVMEGGPGRDTYVFGRGDGYHYVTLSTAGDVDDIELGEGIIPDDLVIEADGRTLAIRGTNDKLSFLDLYDGQGNARIGEMRFANGEVWPWQALRAFVASPDDKNYLIGGLGDDLLVKTQYWQNRLHGLDGDDTLIAAGGGELYGGPGDDVLEVRREPTPTGVWGTAYGSMEGGPGSDTFLIDPATHVTIRGKDDRPESIDRVVLTRPVDPARLSFQISGRDLTVFWKPPQASTLNDDAKLVLEGFMDADGGARLIDEIQFADGVIWNWSQLRDAVLAENANVQSEGADLLTGTDLADEIHGLGGDDRIDGRGGDDTVWAGAGNDSVYGGAGNDRLYGYQAYSSVFSGHDFLHGGPGGDSLNGGNGDDTYYFERGDGFDLIDVTDGTGLDTLLLGPGIVPGDVSVHAYARLGGEYEGMLVMIAGGGGAIHVTGSASGGGVYPMFIDRIAFNDGTVWTYPEIVSRLSAWGERDTQVGASGDDVFEVDHPRDVIVENSGDGIDGVLSWVSYALPNNVENLTLMGELPLEGSGNSGDNLIVGNAAGNRLWGHRVVGRNASFQHDTLVGGLGNDMYHLASGYTITDIIELPGEGNDWIVLSDTTARSITANYTPGGYVYLALPANVENLSMGTMGRTSGGGPRRAVGNALDNLIIGDPIGATIIDGGAGADTLVGGYSSDGFIVDDVDDRVIDTSARDRDEVRSTVDFSLGDNLEMLTLLGVDPTTGVGSALDNVLDGSQNPAANTLVGGWGDDRYIVDALDVVVEEADGGSDTVVIGVGALGLYRVDAYTNVENLELGNAVGAASAQGDAGANVLTGNLHVNLLEGEGGDDSIHGGGGNDSVFGGAGDDWLDGGSGNDFVLGGDGDDNLFDDLGGDTLMGGAGNDIYHVHGGAATQIIELPDEGIDEIRLSGSGAFTLPDHVEHLSAGNASVLIGNGLDNRIAAGEGDDLLEGKAGNDTLIGNGGVDTLSGGGGDDLLRGGAGADVYLFGFGDGHDTIENHDEDAFGVAADRLVFGAGIRLNDVVWRRDADDLVIELAGDEDSVRIRNYLAYKGRTRHALESIGFVEDATALTPAEVMQRMEGESEPGEGEPGETNRSPVAAERFETQTATRGRPWRYGVLGGSFVDPDDGDVLRYSASLSEGGPLPDWLSFDADNREFSGVPPAGLAADLEVRVVATDLAGASAHQDFTLRLVPGASASLNHIIGTLSGETLKGTSKADHIDGLAGNDSLLGQGGDDLLDGGEGNDRLEGGVGSDTLHGGAGNDSLYGNADGDVLEGGNGDDRLYGEAGNDILRGGAGDDSLLGHGGNDLLDGGAGEDHLDGGLGEDTLFGGEGNDSLYGNAGRDTLEGGDGQDSLIGQSGDDLLNGGAGDDRLEGGADNDTLFGGAGNDRLHGDAGSDMLVGDDGDDQLYGAAGGDTLRGGAGNDTLSGGVGSDVFQFGRGDGKDTINNRDASAGRHDKLVFDAGIAADQLWFRRGGNHLEISVIGGDDNIIVSDWYKSSTNRLDAFELSSGERLLRNQVQVLVEAMAAFAPPGVGETQLPPAYADSLGAAIAVNWQ